jgi:hypothetical protein
MTLLSSRVKTQVRGLARARDLGAGVDFGAGERDRTADLPFTRGPVALWTMISSQSCEPCSAAFRLVNGLRDHDSNGAALCRMVPFRLWVPSGDRPWTADLWASCGPGRRHRRARFRSPVLHRQAGCGSLACCPTPRPARPRVAGRDHSAARRRSALFGAGAPHVLKVFPDSPDLEVLQVGEEVFFLQHGAHILDRPLAGWRRKRITSSSATHSSTSCRRDRPCSNACRMPRPAASPS